MPDTLSPLSVNDTMANATLDYQRIMLAEMGIPLWVSHATPVQAIDLAQFDKENFAEHIVIENDFRQDNFANQTPVENTVLISQTISNAQVNSEKSSDLSGLPSNNNEIPAVHIHSENSISTAEDFIVINYSLSCMRVNRWLLLADNAYLSAHPDEQQLWQTIATRMHAEQTMLNFPIVATHPSQPTTQQMSDNPPAQMTFIGFIHSQLVKVDKLTVGAVSPLPEMIENLSLSILNIADIQRLPYLSEMLQDTRQKRQLWELIKK